MGYLKPTAALTKTEESRLLDASALAKAVLGKLKKQPKKDIKDAAIIGRTPTGQALPAPDKISDVYWATGLERTSTPNFITEKFRPQDLIMVGAGYYEKGVSSQVQRRIWKPGGAPMDVMFKADQMKAFEALREARRKKTRTHFVPEDMFGTIEGIRMVRDPSFRIWLRYGHLAGNGQDGSPGWIWCLFFRAKGSRIS